MCGRLVFFLGKATQVLRQQMDGVGGVRKMAIFAEVQYYIHTNVGWMGRSEKVPKCNDVMVSNSTASLTKQVIFHMCG